MRVCSHAMLYVFVGFKGGRIASTDRFLRRAFARSPAPLMNAKKYQVVPTDEYDLQSIPYDVCLSMRVNATDSNLRRSIDP